MDFAGLARINGAAAESRTLQTAVLLGIFDAVADGPRVAGDFTHDPLPLGCDLGFLANIIHGEDEAGVQVRLRPAAALPSGGRIVIKDRILDASLTRSPVGALFSLEMLLGTRGRDSSFEEVREWLHAAGFGSITHRPLAAPLTLLLVTAVKP